MVGASVLVLGVAVLRCEAGQRPGDSTPPSGQSPDIENVDDDGEDAEEARRAVGFVDAIAVSAPAGNHAVIAGPSPRDAGRRSSHCRGAHRRCAALTPPKMQVNAVSGSATCSHAQVYPVPPVAATRNSSAQQQEEDTSCELSSKHSPQECVRDASRSVR